MDNGDYINKTTDAVDILHRRYVGDNAERKASLQAERVNAEIERIMYTKGYISARSTRGEYWQGV